MAKHIFSGNFDRIEHMSKAIKLCETAIKTITVIKFYENYMLKSGRLSWEAYKDKLEQVPGNKTQIPQGWGNYSPTPTN
ncbi:MAG: hypothetical protein ACKPKO_03375 [Candidatus Fonsibacter sp.]